MSSDHRLVIEHMSDGLAFIDKHGRTGGGGLLQPVSEECKMEDPQAGWFGYDGGGSASSVTLNDGTKVGAVPTMHEVCD